MNRTYNALILAVLLIVAGCSSEKSSPTTPINIPSPDGLTVVAQGTSSILLNWNDNSQNEDGFKIERSPFRGDNWAVIATLGRDVETFLDTGLVEGTVYSYYVRAYDDGNFSPSTDTLHRGTRLIQPVNASATAESVLLIALAWEDVSSVETNYRVERKTGNGRFGLIATLPANSTALRDSGLIANTEYTYHIRAVKDSLTSEWTDDVVTRTFQFPPNAPIQLRTSVVNVNTVQVLWRDNSQDEDGFHVERSPVDNIDWQVIGSLTTTAFSDTGLPEGTTFSYRVCSYIGGSNSEYAGPINATTSLYSPEGLEATRESETSISLTWFDASDVETGYQISRRLGLNPYVVLGTTLPAGAEAFTDTGLVKDVTYTFRVRAVHDTIASAWSNESSAHTTLKTPNPPTGLVAEGGFGWPNEAHLTWVDNSSGERNEAGFVIEKSPNGNDSWTFVDSTDADVTTATVGNLASESTWYFHVSTYNEFGISVFSNVANCEIAGIPPSPSGLTAVGSAQTPGCAVLRWTDNSTSESAFIIDVSVDGTTGWVMHDSVAANTNAWIVRDLPAETTRYFRVLSRNQAGRSDYSNVASAEIVGVPPAPTRLVGSAPDYRAAILDWQDNSMSENGFYVERRDAAGFLWRLIHSTEAGVVHYADSSVVAERRYVYRVRSFNDAGMSDSTNNVTLEIPPSPPTTPTDLTASALYVDKIQIAWYDRATNEDAYFVERKGPDEEDFSIIGAFGPDVNVMIDETCHPNSWYTYRVYCENGAGLSAMSDTAGALTWPLEIYSENFESYDVDQVPAGWNQNVAGTSWARVTTTRPHEGDKSLNFHDPDSGANHAWLYTPHTPLEVGTETAWLYIPDSSWFSYHGADEGFTTYTFRFWFMDNDTFSVLNGGQMISYGTYPTDRWFKIDVELHCDSSYYLVYFDDELVTDRCTLPSPTPNAHVAGLAFSDRIVTDAFIDDISATRLWEPRDGLRVNIRRGRVISDSPASIRLGNAQFRTGVRTGLFK